MIAFAVLTTLLAPLQGDDSLAVQRALAVTIDSSVAITRQLNNGAARNSPIFVDEESLREVAQRGQVVMGSGKALPSLLKGTASNQTEAQAQVCANTVCMIRENGILVRGAEMSHTATGLVLMVTTIRTTNSSSPRLRRQAVTYRATFAREGNGFTLVQFVPYIAG